MLIIRLRDSKCNVIGIFCVLCQFQKWFLNYIGDKKKDIFEELIFDR